MHNKVGITLIAGSLLLGGCVAPYVPAPGEAIAQVNLSVLSGPVFMCRGGQNNRLSQDGQGYAQVPAGARVSIEESYMASNGTYSYSCSPGVSFQPEASKHYAMSFDLRDGMCYASLFREDDSTPTGLALEPSVGRPYCK
jgi:hypothetical protein